jgi:hypothetical protein
MIEMTVGDGLIAHPGRVNMDFVGRNDGTKRTAISVITATLNNR